MSIAWYRYFQVIHIYFWKILPWYLTTIVIPADFPTSAEDSFFPKRGGGSCNERFGDSDELCGSSTNK